MYNRVNETLKEQILIPNNITIEINNDHYIVNGKMGKIKTKLDKNIKIQKEENKIFFITESNKKNKKKYLAIIKTNIAIIKNHFKGVNTLFEKIINIKGIGYKAECQNKLLKLFIGYSHPVEIKINEDINIDIINQTNISIKGISKHKVGQLAHEIKMKKPADIYKGNGLKYKDENIKLKTPKKTK